MTIWKLVEQCARELTKNGKSPFTRVDIIKCIQKKNPAYDKDSINPIIQGLTDNLRGGAPGAVGKNILHSVERGLFILNGNDLKQTGQSNCNNPYQAIPKNTKPSKPVDLTTQLTDNKERRIGGYDFKYICNIEPERVPNGSILTFMPQSRYKNINGVSLNKYSKGPFCKFKIPRNLEYPGVYALMDENNLMYIGECVALSSRYNMGYGNISPRNCFVGGQETNCMINNLIYKHLSAGLEISLWFLNTQNYKSIEYQLRGLLHPGWNRI